MPACASVPERRPSAANCENPGEHASPPHDRDRDSCRRSDRCDVGRDVASRLNRLAGTKTHSFLRVSLGLRKPGTERQHQRAIALDQVVAAVVVNTKGGVVVIFGLYD